MSPLAGAPRGGVSLQPSLNQATEPRSGPRLVIIALFYGERSLIGDSYLVFFEEGVLDRPYPNYV